MTHTRTHTVKRGATPRTVALLASPIMIIGAIVGVAVAGAAPASAASDNQDCQYLPAAPGGASWVYLTTIQVNGEQTSYSWSYSGGGVFGWVVKSSTNYNYGTYAAPQTSGTVQSTSLNDNNQLQAISHLTLCGLATMPATTTSLTVAKAWVGTDEGASRTFAATLHDSDAGTLTVTVAGVPTGQTWGATASSLAVRARVVVSEGAVGPLKPSSFPPGYTCSVATAGYPMFTANNFDLTADPSSVTVTNAVTCSAVVTPPGVTPPVVTPPQTPVVTGPGTLTAPAPLPGAVAVPAPAPAVAPAAVAVPNAATVVAPQATVTVPAKAITPSAVNAGGGSQAPSLPLWALALMGVGVLGSIVAGQRLHGTRNRAE